MSLVANRNSFVCVSMETTATVVRIRTTVPSRQYDHGDGDNPFRTMRRIAWRLSITRVLSGTTMRTRCEPNPSIAVDDVMEYDSNKCPRFHEPSCKQNPLHHAVDDRHGIVRIRFGPPLTTPTLLGLHLQRLYPQASTHHSQIILGSKQTNQNE
jgi:hypothetical protein